MSGLPLRRLRIAPRMALATLLGAGSILGVVVALSIRATEALLLSSAEAHAAALADEASGRLAEVVRSVEREARLLARLVERDAPSRREAERLLREAVASRPEVFGAAAAFAPGAVTWAAKAAPYAFRDGPEVKVKDLAVQPGYAYEDQSWYAGPLASRAEGWSAPYDDVGGGGVLMTTFGVPLLGPDGAGPFRGVVTCDLSLDWFSASLGRLPLGEDGYAFLLRRRDGMVLAHPDRSLVMKRTLSSHAAATARPALAALAERMGRGESGYATAEDALDGDETFVTFRPLPNGFALGVVRPRDVVLAPVRRLAWGQAAAGAAGFVLLLAVSFLVATSITRPLRRLEEATRAVAAGDLDAPLPDVPTNDEVGQLAAAFTTMTGDLKRNLAALSAANTARERMEQELSIARSIQMSLVPSTEDVAPGREDVDLAALLEPAREVGGDLYDVFLLDDDTLALAIGDVSGKGIPAALFMARARTLLRTHMRTEPDMSRLLSRLNHELCEANATHLFVTLFCAVVDLPTGRGRFASAGHNPPLLVSGAGGVRELPLTRGFVLGMFERASFEEAAFSIAAGETLVLFTDGVTEAMNGEDEPFGDERLAAALGPLAGRSCREVVAEVRASVAAHAAGAAPSDDITLLAFRRLPAARGGG